LGLDNINKLRWKILITTVPLKPAKQPK
jgi:hypothetical protein